MSAALAIAAKDLRQRVRDRSAILVALVVPLALAALFGAALHDVGRGIRFEVAVADLDRGEAARPFDDLLRRLERRGVLRVRTARSAAEARRLADRGTVAASFVVPAGFTDAVVAGEGAQIRVIGDLDRPIGTLVARSVAEAYAGELTGVRLAVAAAGGDPDLADAAAALPRAIQVSDVTAERRQLDMTTFYAAGMAVFFVFFTVQFGISSIFDERREGTLARLLAAPIPRRSILAAKALTSVVLGVVATLVLVVATTFLLGAHWGNPVGVAILVVAVVLAATSVTALVSSLARDVEQASSWLSIVAVVLGMLGGSFFPVARAGGAIELASRLTPHAWFLEGLTDLRGGSGPGSVVGATAAILAFAAVTGALALVRLDRLVQR